MRIKLILLILIYSRRFKMKIKAVAILGTLTCSLSAWAEVFNPEINLNGSGAAYDLSWLTSTATAKLRYDYPGYPDGKSACSLLFRNNPKSSTTMKEILNALDLSHDTPDWPNHN